ncbi:MAG: type IV pilus secretin PilQ [Gammaproteobacteria bacterium]|nr:type IV pilus secretin PilQ [Gammaproteobacteria bacterium]MDH3506383.1 type IV pilus secretin PilQ [Gammaproteobacteria bacterium]
MTTTALSKPEIAATKIGRRLAGFAGIAAMLLAALSAMAQGTARQLEAIDVQSLPGQLLEIRLRLSDTPPEPMSFTIDNPARIALDLPDTTIGMDSRRQDVNQGPLATVLTAEASGRTRVVLNMNNMVPYDTRVVGDSIYITLGQQGSEPPAAFAAQPASQAAPANAGSATVASGRAINNIDFRRGRGGAGQIVVDLSNPRTTVDVREEGGRIIVDFQDTTLPTALMQRLDVTDFATPVATVDALRSDNNARLVVTTAENYEQVAYQTDNVFTLELTPPIEEPEPVGVFNETREYSGERLTLNFQDIETRAVLQLLADTSDLNIVVSDTVQGNVTLRLQNVPWDQALDILMTTKGLDMRRNGSVIIVAPAEEIAARERAQLEAMQEIQTLEPLRSEFIQVNYAKATDLALLITESGQNPLISERGSVAIDERTNTLLVQDTSERLANIRRLVTTLDIPVRQVLIESRIVIVNDDYNRELGVRFGSTIVKENSSDGLVSLTGSSTGSDTIVTSGLNNLNTTGQPFPVNVPPINQRYNVNVPSATPVGAIALAILDSDYLVDLELSALEAEGQGDIISAPRIVTANQREATIEQGVEIPYQESSSSGATTTQFRPAVLSLTVTPQVTPDDRIIMDLLVTKDSVGELVASATGGFVPSIDTRSVTTQVLVNDGETVVLGGIYETESRETINKVPFLGDVPGLGMLFRSRATTNNKAELLIFVTPKILREGASLY